MANKLEESPEFQAALNEACEKQYRGYLYGGGYAKASSEDKIADTMKEMQRQREEIEARVAGARLHAEQVRLMSDPHAREITEAQRKRHSADGGLVCPSCGDTDHGNRMGKQPWCMRCQLPLMSQEKAEKWVKPEKPKPRNYTFNEPDGVTRCRR